MSFCGKIRAMSEVQCDDCKKMFDQEPFVEWMGGFKWKCRQCVQDAMSDKVHELLNIMIHGEDIESSCMSVVAGLPFKNPLTLKGWTEQKPRLLTYDKIKELHELYTPSKDNIVGFTLNPATYDAFINNVEKVNSEISSYSFGAGVEVYSVIKQTEPIIGWKNRTMMRMYLHEMEDRNE